MSNTMAINNSLRSLSLKQVRASILQLHAQQNIHNAYRIGQFYNYLVDTKLAQKANYKGALDYLHRRVGVVPRSTLLVYSTVARHFSEVTCTRYGSTTLCLLLTYEEAAGIQANRTEPGNTLIHVPSSNGAVTRKPFRECSVQDMRMALQRLREPSTGTAKARNARNHTAPSQGEVVIHFKNMPQSQVKKLSKALLGQFQPLGVKARVA
jgi:hypothetical protein